MARYEPMAGADLHLLDAPMNHRYATPPSL